MSAREIYERSKVVKSELHFFKDIRLGFINSNAKSIYQYFNNDSAENNTKKRMFFLSTEPAFRFLRLPEEHTFFAQY